MAPGGLINLFIITTTMLLILQLSSQCSNLRLAPDITGSPIHLSDSIPFGNPPHQAHHRWKRRRHRPRRPTTEGEEKRVIRYYTRTAEIMDLRRKLRALFLFFFFFKKAITLSLLTNNLLCDQRPFWRGFETQPAGENHAACRWKARTHLPTRFCLHFLHTKTERSIPDCEPSRSQQEHGHQRPRLC